jgi:hypothetical protein
MPVGPSTLSIGQPVRFRLVSFADAYGHLYVFSASGRSQLWLENVHLRAGVPINYPRPGQIVRAAPPAGDEIVMFVATRAPIKGFVGSAVSTTPIDLQFSHEARSQLQQTLDQIPRPCDRLDPTWRGDGEHHGQGAVSVFRDRLVVHASCIARQG